MLRETPPEGCSFQQWALALLVRGSVDWLGSLSRLLSWMHLAADLGLGFGLLHEPLVLCCFDSYSSCVKLIGLKLR